MLLKVFFISSVVSSSSVFIFPPALLPQCLQKALHLNVVSQNKLYNTGFLASFFFSLSDRASDGSDYQSFDYAEVPMGQAGYTFLCQCNQRKGKSMTGLTDEQRVDIVKYRLENAFNTLSEVESHRKNGFQVLFPVEKATNPASFPCLRTVLRQAKEQPYQAALIVCKCYPDIDE